MQKVNMNILHICISKASYAEEDVYCRRSSDFQIIISLLKSLIKDDQSVKKVRSLIVQVPKSLGSKLLGFRQSGKPQYDPLRQTALPLSTAGPPLAVQTFVRGRQ